MRLLVVDDEPNVLYPLEQGLQADDLEVLTAPSGKEGVERTRRGRPDAVLLDLRLTDMSGLEVLDRIREIDPHLPVIVVTAYAATETAIEAVKRGAFEYLLKPVDLHQLRAMVGRALEQRRLTRAPAVPRDTAAGAGDGVDEIVGRSAGMQEVYKAIGRLAPQDETVLILGESGTGKELVARALCQHSRRAGGPFIPLNCAAIPESLLESQLFGHEKGAFTGAERRRAGKFELAHDGTIFLDEIGDMAAAAQAKMLRLLQERRFERLGGNETVEVDVRVIAATNQNLDTAVAEGRFRQDLFCRLNGCTIRLPPLREHREDLPLLVEHFIRLSNRDLSRCVHSVSPEAMRLLEAYGWPGNVRELHGAVRYATVHARGEVLTPDCLPEAVRGRASPSAQPQRADADGAFDLARFVEGLLDSGEMEVYHKASLAADRVILEAVLRHARGSQVKASELLGISRTTLRAKLRTLGMTLEKQVLPEADRVG